MVATDTIIFAFFISLVFTTQKNYCNTVLFEPVLTVFMESSSESFLRSWDDKSIFCIMLLLLLLSAVGVVSKASVP